jgi:hypothetical protein
MSRRPPADKGEYSYGESPIKPRSEALPHYCAIVRLETLLATITSACADACAHENEERQIWLRTLQVAIRKFTILSQYSGTDSAAGTNQPASWYAMRPSKTWG